jgi:hypothetical protein
MGSKPDNSDAPYFSVHAHEFITCGNKSEGDENCTICLSPLRSELIKSPSALHTAQLAVSKKKGEIDCASASQNSVLVPADSHLCHALSFP